MTSFAIDVVEREVSRDSLRKLPQDQRRAAMRIRLPAPSTTPVVGPIDAFIAVLGLNPWPTGDDRRRAKDAKARVTRSLVQIQLFLRGLDSEHRALADPDRGLRRSPRKRKLPSSSAPVPTPSSSPVSTRSTPTMHPRVKRGKRSRTPASAPEGSDRVPNAALSPAAPLPPPAASVRRSKRSRASSPASGSNRKQNMTLHDNHNPAFIRHLSPTRSVSTRVKRVKHSRTSSPSCSRGVAHKDNDKLADNGALPSMSPSSSESGLPSLQESDASGANSSADGMAPATGSSVNAAGLAEGQRPQAIDATARLIHKDLKGAMEGLSAKRLKHTELTHSVLSRVERLNSRLLSFISQYVAFTSRETSLDAGDRNTAESVRDVLWRAVKCVGNINYTVLQKFDRANHMDVLNKFDIPSHFEIKNAFEPMVGPMERALKKPSGQSKSRTRARAGVELGPRRKRSRKCDTGGKRRTSKVTFAATPTVRVYCKHDPPMELMRK